MSRRLIEQLYAGFEPFQSLSTGARFVLCIFCQLADDTTLEVQPGVPFLMTLTGYGERQVQRYVKELSDRGLVEVIQNSGGRRKYAAYRVSIGVRASSLFEGPQ